MLLFSSNRGPSVLNRLRSAADNALRLTTREAYVMDSGMAAIVGARLTRMRR